MKGGPAVAIYTRTLRQAINFERNKLGERCAFMLRAIRVRKSTRGTIVACILYGACLFGPPSLLAAGSLLLRPVTRRFVIACLSAIVHR